MKFQRKTVLPALALLSVTTAAFPADPICSSPAADQDGDGWGWENNSSCVVSDDSAAPAMATLSLAAIPAGQNVCSSAAADPDGDGWGWGWENNDSCVVVATTSQSTSTQTITANITTVNGVRACSSSAADPDGDGWGWENNDSCQVISGSAATPPAPGNATNTTTSPITSNTVNSGIAVCSSTSFDQDGDGWGWENNDSCQVTAATQQAGQATASEAPATPETPAAAPVVVAAPVEPAAPAAPPPACSLPSFDDDGDGFGFENGGVCAVQTPVNIRIMAVGDSITHGTSRGSAESYRKPFNDLMNSNSCQFEMVGSQTGNYLHNTYVSPHEGYNGHTADQILNGFNNVAGNNEGISVTVTRYQPQVVLLHIGSNDMRLGQDINQTVAEIDQIISVILAADSAPAVLLANIIPWYENATVGANVVTLGDRVTAYVTQLNNPRVQLVDVRSGYQQSMMRSDLAHPNPAGEQHIAQRFFSVYNSSGFCR